MDHSSAIDWVAALDLRNPSRDEALDRLHQMLVKVAYNETARRVPLAVVSGADRDDFAHDAASDAMVAILHKLPEFRGESRFTTWAYKFVILEVAHRIGRLYWQREHRPISSLVSEDWDRFEVGMGLDPQASVEARDLALALRRAIAGLTDHQRDIFEAIVIEGIPLDALVARRGGNRNAIYKVIFDARRKIRAALVADGYMESEGSAR